MKKITFPLLVLFLLLSSCTTQQINDTLSIIRGANLTTDDIAAGLRQALSIGAENGASELSRDGGYFNDLAYRILLPEEARKVTDRLRVIPGFTDLEGVVIKKINQGAEDAAKEAAPIFLSAIKAMTIQDALGILKGDKDAATQYLNRVTYDQLYQKFNPVITTSLDKFEARTVWSDATTAYNRIPFINPVNVELGDYVTRQALDGLFKKVALKELDIRTNIKSRTTELLQKVFAQQDAK